jgi:hypothetical protein
MSPGIGLLLLLLNLNLKKYNVNTSNGDEWMLNGFWGQVVSVCSTYKYIFYIFVFNSYWNVKRGELNADGEKWI